MFLLFSSHNQTRDLQPQPGDPCGWQVPRQRLDLSKRRKEPKWAALAAAGLVPRGWGSKVRGSPCPAQNPQAEAWASVGIRIRGWGANDPAGQNQGGGQRDAQTRGVGHRPHLSSAAPKGQQNYGLATPWWAKLPTSSGSKLGSHSWKDSGCLVPCRRRTVLQMQGRPGWDLPSPNPQDPHE